MFNQKNNRNYDTVFCLLLFLSVFTLQGLGEGKSEKELTRSIQSNKTVQDEFMRIVDVLSSEQSDEAKASELEAFKTYRNMKTEDVLLQCLLSYDPKADRQKDPARELAKRLIVGNLIKDIHAETLVGAVIPHLEKTSDPVLKKNLRMTLDVVILKSTQPDLVMLKKHLDRKKGEQSQASLIRYMYRANPKKALMIMAETYGDAAKAKSVEKVVMKKSDAEALQQLATGGVWWENLYVAERLKRKSKLKSPEIINKLKQSNHPFVLQALAEMD